MSTDAKSNGRDTGGRFTKGNPGGPGNPHAAQAARLRSALLEAVTTDDVEAIARRMVEEAKAGNVQAGRELLDRLLGKAHQTQSTDIAATIETAEIEQVADRMGALTDEQLAALEQLGIGEAIRTNCLPSNGKAKP